MNGIYKIIFMLFFISSCYGNEVYDFEIAQHAYPDLRTRLSNTIKRLENNSWPELTGFVKNLSYENKRKIIETLVRFIHAVYDDMSQVYLPKTISTVNSRFEKDIEIPDLITINRFINTCSARPLLKLLYLKKNNPDFIPAFVNIVFKNKIYYAVQKLSGKENVTVIDFQKFLKLMISIFSNPALSRNTLNLIFKQFNDSDYGKLEIWLSQIISVPEKKQVIINFFYCMKTFDRSDYITFYIATLASKLKFKSFSNNLHGDVKLLQDSINFLYIDKDMIFLMRYLLNRFATSDKYNKMIEQAKEFLHSQSWQELKNLF